MRRHPRERETEKAPKATAADFHPEVLRLFDSYVHGRIDRRGFLEGAAKFAVGGVTRGGAARGAEPRLRRRRAGAEDRSAHRRRAGRVPVAAGLRHRPRLPGAAGERAAAGGPRRRRAACRRSSSSTRTAASTRTSRTSRAGSRSTTSSPSRPTRCFRSAAIPGDEDKAREMFGQARPGQDARGLRRRRALPARACPAATASSARSASAGAAAWSTSWRRGCPSSSAAVPFYGAGAGARQRRRDPGAAAAPCSPTTTTA